MKKTTYYKQGNQWIVSSWDEQYKAYTLSSVMSYWQARAIAGRDNCKAKNCKKHDHN